MSVLWCVIALGLCWCGGLVVDAGPTVLRNGGYEGIVVSIDDSVPAENCRTILNNLEVSLARASQLLHSALDGRAFVRSATVLLPDSWDDSCSPRYVTASSGEVPDVRVGVTHPVFGDSSWTQQSQGCGEPGDFIYTSYKNLLHGKHMGQSIMREWAKYRYGVFDETGKRSDAVYPACYRNSHNTSLVTGCSDKPIKDGGVCANSSAAFNASALVSPDAKSSIMFAREASHVTKFCDAKTHNKYAPTKHNLVCDRKSALEVILQHPDFANSVGNFSGVTNTTPTVMYKRRRLTRYVLVVEDTAAMQVRESWGFLRTAVRKWLVYDLPLNTEVGVVLCNESSASSLHRISTLESQSGRDFLAAMFPYAPGDSRAAGCLHCGVREALNMLKDRAASQGPASSVIVLIAPGMDHVPEISSLLPRAVSFGVRLVTINYPNTTRKEPLDTLARATGGVSFTVQEQGYNMATSYLTTYFKLTNILFSVAVRYHEGRRDGMPVEVHRRELFDDGRTSITGSFVLEDYLGEPAQFNVFTYNPGNPLIRSMSLTSPSQAKYIRRSDSMLTVKILTLPINLNETGTWTYEIERFPGNPQPHFIQVMATPKSKVSPIVRARAWTSTGKSPLILYTEVKRGDFPVLGARVEVVVSRPGMNGSYSYQDRFELLDTGNGDPDITKGDGVYSRYFSALSEGMHTFEIVVMDNGNTAYSWQENAAMEKYYECCGNSIPTPAVQPLSPFQRVLAPITVNFNTVEVGSQAVVGRIGDLKAQVIASDLKARLTWTAPDVGSIPVARYEIRFAHSLSDIVDHYEKLGQIWEYGTPFPLAPGSETTFTLDFTRNPSLLDQPMFIRMRAFADSMEGSASSAASNWVYLMVPSPPPAPTVPSTLPTLFQDSPRPNENADATSIIPGIAQGDKLTLELILPIAGGVALLVVCVIVYCCICLLRKRNGHPSKKQKAKDKHTCNGKQHVTCPSTPVTVIPSSPVHNMLGKSSPQPPDDSLPPEYEERIGDEKQCFNVVQLQQEDQMLTEQQEQLLHQQQWDLAPHVVALPSVNNMSAISAISSGNGGTVVQGGRTLSPYQSWTASQLLHEHENRQSPYGTRPEDEMMQHSVNGHLPPPVPPLPSHSHNGLYSSGHIYGVHSGQYQSPTGYHRSESFVPFNTSLQGSLSSVIGADRKKRNVTMV